MSMDSTFPLVAFKRDYSFTIEIELEGDDSGDTSESFTFSESGIHMYGTTVGGEAAAGTLLAEIQSDIDSSAFAGDFPDYGDAVFTWQHGPSKGSLVWKLDIAIGETAVGGQMEVTAGDSRQLGLYSTGSIAATVAGNVITFTGQFTPSGVWAPCMPNELRSPDREYVLKMARNPRSPANFSRIQHAQTTYQNVTWTDVSGFYRDDFRQSQSHYQGQVGFDLPQDPAVPTLETLLDAWAGGSDLQLWTGKAAYLDVDLVNRDTFRVSSLASEGSAGGSRFTVEMEFVEV